MSRSKQIVVITDRRDVHVPLVQRHLDDPLILLDPQSLVRGTTLSFKLEGKDMLTIWDGKILDRVTGVWYRKPGNITMEMLAVQEEFKKYSFDSLRSHSVMLLTAFRQARWVSDYYAIRKASDKALQLDVAAKLGFNIPDTVMTSDAAVAQQFIEKQGECIMKVLAPFYPTIDGTRKSLFANRINKDSMPDLTGLSVSPAIFQELIEPLYDIRATVVGDRVFAATIRNSGLDPDSNIRDWRIGHFEGDLEVKAYKLPSDIADLCVQHVKTLGLSLGAIDLILDKNGKFWFLENNPNGQWGFVEHLTGQPIGEAVARLLDGK